jgi:hypothetical protein
MKWGGGWGNGLLIQRHFILPAKNWQAKVVGSRGKGKESTIANSPKRNCVAGTLEAGRRGMFVRFL